MKYKYLILLFLVLFSCRNATKTVTLEVTYFDNSKEEYSTQILYGCNVLTQLKCGCTDCFSDTRCNVKSIKIIKIYE